MNELWFIQEVQDRRIKAGKLKNWRRRYRGEASRGLMSLPQGNGSQVAGSAAQKCFFPAKTQFSINSGEFSIVEAAITQELGIDGQPTISGIDENWPTDKERSRPASTEFSPMNICQDSESFDWSKVDVPGSPRLSRLFKRLEIDSMVHIPPLSLDNPDSEYPPCHSNLEIQESLIRGNRIASKDFHIVHSSWAKRYFTPPEKETEQQLPHYPWKNIEVVFCGYTSSPLNEVYVWPPSPPRRPCRKPPHSAIPTWTDLEKQGTELHIKVVKLRDQFPEDSLAVTGSMEELVNVYSKLGKHYEAESIYRKLEEVYRRTLGPNHIGTLEVCHKVIKSLKDQFYYSKAKSLNDNLRRVVCKLVLPDHHPLAIRVFKMDAWLAEVLGGSEACENARREMLQLALVSYGPRHPDTIQALSFLGHTISQKGIIAEGGESLLRTALELSLQDPYQEDFVSCAMMNDLAYALNFNGFYEESCRVATSAQERFSPLLGPNHIFLISLEEQRARSLLEMGELDESKALFRQLVDVYETRNLGTHNSDVSNAWCGLGNALANLGLRKEATCWYERYMSMRISSDRGIDTAFIDTGFKLLYCYQEQNRFDDALTVYYQMMDKFPKSSEDRFERSWKRHLESEIRWIEAKLEDSSDEWSVDEGDGVEYDGDSSDAEDNDWPEET